MFRHRRPPHLVRRFRQLLVVAGALALAACNLTPQRGPSERHVEELIHLTNVHVRVGVSVRTGRLLEFMPPDGLNLLWVNDEAFAQPPAETRTDYRNYGGDKVWPTLQALWTHAYGRRSDWPPDGIIDGQPWTLLHHDARRVVMRSNVHPTLGVFMQRDIRLAEHEAMVHIINRLTRVQPSVFPVHLWTVTQVRPPTFVLMDIAPDRALAEPWITFARHEPRAARLLADASALHLTLADESQPGKVGTLGRWVAGVWDEWVFYQHTDDYAPAAAYPEASNVQTYVDEHFAELELLSPLVHLQSGESIEHTTTWRLLPREGRSADQLLEALRSLTSDPTSATP